jgi:hypothetical protein
MLGPFLSAPGVRVTKIFQREKGKAISLLLEVSDKLG